MGYEIGTGKVVADKMVKYEVMAKDFAAKRGWYGFFFNEPDGYTFRVNFRPGVMWKKKGPNTFVCPQSWPEKRTRLIYSISSTWRPGCGARMPSNRRGDECTMITCPQRGDYRHGS
jgi:hypothetical protein